MRTARLSTGCRQRRNWAGAEAKAISARSVSSLKSLTISAPMLFDQNRDNGALADLFDLDFASTDTIRSTFSQLASRLARTAWRFRAPTTPR